MGAFIIDLSTHIASFLTRYFVFILAFLVIAGPIWIYLDARLIWRKDNRGLPAWVWIISYLGGGFWIPPIYWIVRKPRSVSRFVLAIVVFWMLPFGFPLGRIYVNKRLIQQRQVNAQKVKIGMTDQEVLSILDYMPDVDTTFEDTIGRTIEKWTYTIHPRKGWYKFTFVDDTLSETEFEESVYEGLRKIMEKQK